MSRSLTGQFVGFVGLGLMGRPMGMNLHAAGAEVIIHNRSRAAVDALAAEGLTPASPTSTVTPIILADFGRARVAACV